ncbi:MAG: 4-hydroxy-tetrahydrodipicolinate reductase [Elusimicrobiales bacterium]|jgi:4-hydroxy-tetrahydrodipicolinate reductase
MSVSKTAVLVLGAAGRMGVKIVEKVRENPHCVLSGALDLKSPVGADPRRVLEASVGAAAVVIDFTTPEAGVVHAGLCAGSKKPLVIGTTGFDAGQLARLKEFSGSAPIFLSPNMSPAVNLTIAVARLMAAKLPDFDVRISETHHRSKKDSPSGTALKYQAVIKEVHPGEVPVVSVRAGDIVGEHTVLYAGPCERVELTHRAHSREVFAEGAVRAALWLKDRKPGLYDYFDLLGLKSGI